MNRKRSFFAIPAAILFLLISVLGAQARTAYIDYNDGDRDSYGCDHSCFEDDVYAMRFDPPSPVRVQKVRFYAQNEGELEMHLWVDDGGVPDMTRDLMAPVEVEIEEGENYYYIELDEPVTIDPALPFHVGFVKGNSNGGFLCHDATIDHARRSTFNKGEAWENLDEDWVVSVFVEFYDEPTEFIFSDATADGGIAGLGARVAWGDYNNDDHPDLLLSGSILYRNEGDGTFTDVSSEAGVGGLPSNGGVWADFDNDGNLDFFAMVNSLTEYDRFLQNNGDGTFTDITDTALSEEDKDLFPTEGAGWGDFNKDGFLDVYLANYEMPGDELALGTPDKLYMNNGDGTFTDVAESLGIDPGETDQDRMCGRGVNWGDFNDDGWPDIYVSNYRLDPNFLYMNNGDGTFTEASEEKGVQGYLVTGAWGHTIGSMWGDFNNDGYLDLFNANLAHPRFASFSDPSFLFLNNGPPDYDFTDFSAEAQVIYIETNSEPCLGDWNNDGWLDLLVTNVYEDFWQQLYRNDGDATLTEMTYGSGLDIENGWGAAFADYNDDGYLDLFARSGVEGGGGLWKNNGNNNHWLKVKLECTTGDPFCVGARVTVQTAHDKGPQAKEVISGKGTANSPPFVLHFGLNQCENAWSVTVKFPSGAEVTRYEVAADQTITVNEQDDSDDEPAVPTEPSSCADVDYPNPEWPPADDDDSSDDDDDSADDDAVDDDDSESPGSSDDDDDDDDEGCCG